MLSVCLPCPVFEGNDGSDDEQKENIAECDNEGQDGLIPFKRKIQLL